MSRISNAFARLKREGKKGFIPFITAGDPDLATTGELIVALAQAGATVIELGVPFSDPMADGPVIQRASERALQHGFDVAEVLEMVGGVRRKTDVPIILFSYFNPLLQFCVAAESQGTAGRMPALPGFDVLARAAKNAGIDGVLVTDLSPEEATGFAAAWRAQDLDMIFLVAPTSTDTRLRTVAERASGFIYAVSRAGVTGRRQEMSDEAEKLVTRLRQFSALPVAVGFGISNAQHITDVWRYADAAVVGSALVAEIERLGGSPDLVSQVMGFVKDLLPIL